VVSQKNGVWGAAEALPGAAAEGDITSVSCGSAGNCGAGGDTYTDGNGHTQAFVVSETNGRWVKAEEVPGTAALNKGRGAGVSSVSCPSARTCIAVGSYTDAKGHTQAFVGGAK
jgi:hypothetical protein